MHCMAQHGAAAFHKAGVLINGTDTQLDALPLELLFSLIAVESTLAIHHKTSKLAMDRHPCDVNGLDESLCGFG